jgi:hypothetical protein
LIFDNQAIGIFKNKEEVEAYPHWAGARPGDIIFKDVNEDGVIDGNDRVRAVTLRMKSTDCRSSRWALTTFRRTIS